MITNNIIVRESNMHDGYLVYFEGCMVGKLEENEKRLNDVVSLLGINYLRLASKQNIVEVKTLEEAQEIKELYYKLFP